MSSGIEAVLFEIKLSRIRLCTDLIVDVSCALKSWAMTVQPERRVKKEVTNACGETLHLTVRASASRPIMLGKCWVCIICSMFIRGCFWV
jgi:hypothetical protein